MVRRTEQRQQQHTDTAHVLLVSVGLAQARPNKCILPSCHYV